MKISEINIYPVKSLKGIALDQSIIEDRGLQNDRRFMLIDENNDLFTQREMPALARVSTRYVKQTLEISFDGESWHSMSRHFDKSKTEKVRVWNSHCDALVADGEINSRLSDALGKKLRLVEMPPSTRRGINEGFNKGNEIVSFADGYPLLIIGEESLRDLNSRLEKEIPMNRFRPNLVVSDVNPYAEDNWKKIKIGKTVFRATKPCARCVVTTIDQETGISDVKEPLKTFATYRKSTDIFPDTFEDYGLSKNDVLFGQNLVAENFGEGIKVGDEVEILETN